MDITSLIYNNLKNIVVDDKRVNLSDFYKLHIQTL